MGKNGNGEGSIYSHKRNGKKVGYRGAYVVQTAEDPKRRYVSGKTRDEVHDKLIEALGNRTHGLVFDMRVLTAVVVRGCRWLLLARPGGGNEEEDHSHQGQRRQAHQSFYTKPPNPGDRHPPKGEPT